MFRKSLIISAIAFMLLSVGCAVPTYHFDSGSDWVKRKEESFSKAELNWTKYNDPKNIQIPHLIYKYVGYKETEKGKVMTFSDIDRLDYFHGYIYVRKDPKTIGFLSKWIPAGIFSFEVMGIIGSEKEWISRPSLPAFLIQLGLTTVSGAAFIAPTRVWEEECFHVSQEILHPRFSYWSKTYYYNITGRNTPVVSHILQPLLYFTNPMEIDAKIKKWVYAGFVWNLDCDSAWRRYNTLLTSIAYRKAKEAGSNPSVLHFAQAVIKLTNLRYNNVEEMDIRNDNNPVLNEAKELVGIIHRRPYEEKFVYSPWVPGVMREKEELPWFTRTFLWWAVE